MRPVAPPLLATREDKPAERQRLLTSEVNERWAFLGSARVPIWDMVELSWGGGCKIRETWRPHV